MNGLRSNPMHTVFQCSLKRLRFSTVTVAVRCMVCKYNFPRKIAPFRCTHPSISGACPPELIKIIYSVGSKGVVNVRTSHEINNCSHEVCVCERNAIIIIHLLWMERVCRSAGAYHKRSSQRGVTPNRSRGIFARVRERARTHTFRAHHHNGGGGPTSAREHYQHFTRPERRSNTM